MLQKILVPLDGSPLAERILPYAVLLATNFKAEIILLRVVRKENRSTAELKVKQEKVTEYLEQLRAALLGEWQGNNALTQAVRVFVARARPSQTGTETTEEWPYRVTALVATGAAAPEIIVVAEAQQAGLIALSTHGRTGLNRLMSGSITAGVLHNSRFPVMVVRPQPQDEKKTLAEAFQSVPPNLLRRTAVVPLSGAQLDQKALALLHRKRPLPIPPVTLLEVVPDSENVLRFAPMALPGYLSTEGVDLEKIEEDARNYLAELKSGPLSDLPQVNVQLLHGNPALQITDYARQHCAGFIIMASHARTGVSRMAFGSVTAEVVLHSDGIPVIVVTPSTRLEDE